MPYKNKEKQKEAQNKWYREVVKPRKEAWFKENGPCVVCGSWENLELHHKDPAKKESHNVWTWKEERRLAELAKCEVRCTKCHDDAHYVEPPEGMAWCSNCKQYVPLEKFGPQNRPGERRKVRSYCNSCRKLIGWKK